MYWSSQIAGLTLPFKIHQTPRGLMIKSRTPVIRTKLDIMNQQEQSSLPQRFRADDSLRGETGLTLNLNYLNDPDVTIILRMDQKGFDEPCVYEGDLVVADRRVKPEDGNLVIATIDGEIVVRQL